MSVKLQAGKFYGSTMRSVELTGFRYTEKSYEPQKILPSHAHELAHFCLVLAGNYTEKLAGRTEERAPSTLIFYPPDATHAEKHHTRGRHFLIEFDQRRTESLRDYGLIMTEPAAYSGVYNSITSKLYREFCEPDALSLLALEALTVELIVEVLRRQRKNNERQASRWLDDVKQILHETYTEPLTLDQIASAVEVHPVHMVRVFKKFHQCTIGEYIRQLRIREAQRQILVSDSALVEIALATGFADQTHFTRSFKRVTGMTPSEFRKITR